MLPLQPLSISFPQRDLDDLRERLARTRLGEAIPGAGWDYGIDLAWLADALEYWRTRFDWRAVERELGRYEHALGRVNGQDIHFLRARSPVPGAMPLLLVHGWPGSVLEFRRLLPLLVDPAAHGGDARDAFEVIAPSIPGYGLSPAPKRRGYDVKACGEDFAALMAGLGHDRYVAQGGDWGASIVPYAALADPGRCAGIHLNLLLAGRPPGESPPLDATEEADLEVAREYMRRGTAYQKVQGFEPDLIGVALDDSPAALLAWIATKFRAWSDSGGDLDARIPRDELLANVTWTWLTRTGASSARLYLESRVSGRFGPVERRVDVPTACALFPRELFLPPRAWVERLYNVQRWTRMPRGGHFAAMEEPELLAADLREFVRGLR